MIGLSDDEKTLRVKRKGSSVLPKPVALVSS